MTRKHRWAEYDAAARRLAANLDRAVRLGHPDPETLIADTATALHQLADRVHTHADEIGGDYLTRFVRERLELSSTTRTRTQDVRSSYEDWCRQNGIEPLNRKRLGMELAARFEVDQVRASGERYYLVGLAEPSGPESGSLQ